MIYLMNVVFMAPLGILTGGLGIGGAKKLSEIKDLARHFGIFLALLEYFLLILIVCLLVISLMKIYFVWNKYRFKKILILFYRLYTELLLFKTIGKISAEGNKLKIELSKEESIGYLQKLIRKRFFIKKLGRHNYQRILDGLKLIEKNKIDFEMQISLVNNWINLIKLFY